MNETLVTEPTIEIMTLDELKRRIRVEHDDDDSTLTAYLAAARKLAEDNTRLGFINATWTNKMDAFPQCGVIEPSRAPLVSVTSITYIDTNGDTQTWSADDYDVDTDSKPGRITPAYGESWPTTRITLNAVTVTFVAGYGATRPDVPDGLRQAVAMLVGHWNENREAFADISSGFKEVPMAVESLLAQHALPEEG